MFAIGLTDTEVPVKPPGFQVYVNAPNPLKVAVEPKHIAVGLELAVTEGLGLTTKFRVPLAGQPNDVVPVTV